MFKQRRLPLAALFAFAASIAVAVEPSIAAQFAPPPWTPNPNCTPNIVPTGQANPSMQAEPLAPIWCFDLAQEPTTRVTGANDWVDTFQTNIQMGRLNDGDMDYRIFDRVHDDGSSNQTLHFINNTHWMTDTGGGTDNGDSLRPNRSFTFENGKLLVEADIAAGLADYGTNQAWPEITVSMAPQPTGDVVDSLYAYGGFGGAWTVGCRLHPLGNPVCAVETGAKNITTTNENRDNCFAGAPARVMEISDNQTCGTIHSGGNRGGDNANFWRRCDANQMDLYCRDRMRLELTKSSLTLFVNGHQYFQDADWPVDRQLPDSMVNGGQVYVYFSDWRARPTAPVYRFHWGRLAINPHNPDGSIVDPSAAPFFCLGEPQNTCDLSGTMNMPMPGMDMSNPPAAPDSTSPDTTTDTSDNSDQP